MEDFSQTWLQLIARTLSDGDIVAPRGQVTKEIAQHTVIVNMRKPVLMVPQRGLSYKFMAAEAFWIISGDNRVETIKPYSARIADFSDDGETFFGAYGPKIHDQIMYVVTKLAADRDTRQAGLTIWRENPPYTKDVPCTVAIFFGIRKHKLNCHVFMRSSDQWLGLPYDTFNFSMLSHLVCALLNESQNYERPLEPGTLYLTAASSHLYESNLPDVILCLNDIRPIIDQPETPNALYQNSINLMGHLKALRDTTKGHELRWWEKEN